MCAVEISFRKKCFISACRRISFTCEYDKVKTFSATSFMHKIMYIFFSDSVAKHSVPVLVGRSDDVAYRTTAAGPPVAALLYNGNNNNIITAGRARP